MPASLVRLLLGAAPRGGELAEHLKEGRHGGRTGRLGLLLRASHEATELAEHIARQLAGNQIDNVHEISPKGFRPMP